MPGRGINPPTMTLNTRPRVKYETGPDAPNSEMNSLPTCQKNGVTLSKNCMIMHAKAIMGYMHLERPGRYIA